MTDPELDRIRKEYERREREIPADFYAFHREANLFALHERERGLRQLLQEAELLPLTGKRLLEVGCGAGEWFATFRRFGLDSAHLCGIDLDPNRLAAAHDAAPGADLRVGDASSLPWGDESFDLVFQSTVLSSVLGEAMKERIASEMMRVLKPGGAVVSYDFAVNNPFNRAVRGVSKKELARLFNGSRSYYANTLAPPIARRLVPLSWTLARLLERLKVLDTHLFALIRKD